MQVAGVLLGPAVSGAQQRQDRRRPPQPVQREMATLDVRELVAKVETQRLRLRTQRFDDAAVDNDIVKAQESRRHRIQHAIAHHDVGGWQVVNAQLMAGFPILGVKIRELPFAQLDGVAAQVRN